MEDERVHRRDEITHQLDHLATEALLEFVPAVPGLILALDAERAVEVVARITIVQCVQHHAPSTRTWRR